MVYGVWFIVWGLWFKNNLSTYNIQPTTYNIKH